MGSPPPVNSGRNITAAQNFTSICPIEVLYRLLLLYALVTTPGGNTFMSEYCRIGSVKMGVVGTGAAVHTPLTIA